MVQGEEVRGAFDAFSGRCSWAVSKLGAAAVWHGWLLPLKRACWIMQMLCVLCFYVHVHASRALLQAAAAPPRAEASPVLPAFPSPCVAAQRQQSAASLQLACVTCIVQVNSPGRDGRWFESSLR